MESEQLPSIQDSVTIPMIGESTANSESNRSLCLWSLSYLLGCQIIYMYFLDWNFLTFILRAVQLFCVYKASKINHLIQNSTFGGISQLQKSIFLGVIFSNLPVFLIHFIYRESKPMVLTFVGIEEMSSRSTIFLNDIFIVFLETCLILHTKFLFLPHSD